MHSDDHAAGAGSADTRKPPPLPSGSAAVFSAVERSYLRTAAGARPSPRTERPRRCRNPGGGALQGGKRDPGPWNQKAVWNPHGVLVISTHI